MIERRIKLSAKPLIIIVLILFGFLTLYPLWYVFCCSLSSQKATMMNDLLILPTEFTLDNIMYVLNTSDFSQIYINTMFVVFGGTFLSTITTLGFSYGLVKKVPGYKIIIALTFFALVFSGGMIPNFLVVRNTGLLDTLWALIIPRLIDPFMVFLMCKYFQKVPRGIEEAAEVDGIGAIRTFVSIVCPLVLPGIATIMLLYIVSYWNQFLEAILYTSNRPQWTIQVLLSELLVSSQTNAVGDTSSNNILGLSMPIKMATVFISVIPILIVYPLLQKLFIKGLYADSINA